MLGKLFTKSVPPEGESGNQRKGAPVKAGKGLGVGDPTKGELQWFKAMSQKKNNKIPYGKHIVSILVGNRIYFTVVIYPAYFMVLDLDSLVVQSVQSESQPKERVMHTLTLVGDAILFCGGTSYTGQDYEIEAFGVNSETTTVIGKFPGLIEHSTEYSRGRNALVVFGGLEGEFDQGWKDIISDSYRMGKSDMSEVDDKVTNKTRLVFMKGEDTLEEEVLKPSGKYPLPRYGHQSAFSNERLFVFGGTAVKKGDSREDENGLSLFILDLSVSSDGAWSRVQTGMEWYSTHQLDLYHDMVVILGGDTMSQPNSVFALYQPEEKELIKVRSKRNRSHKGDSKIFLRKGKWPYFNHIDLSYVYDGMIHYFQPFEKKISRVSIAMPEQQL